ncbi:MAG TPA: hypothetical protein VIU37_11160 [Candidatus Limnocylindrales bacterium]
MNALFVSPTVDTAGLGIGMKRAFDQYGGAWKARHVRTSNSWLDYGVDLQVGPGDPELVRLWAEADVVVIIEQPHAAQWGPRKPFIVWHLGTYFRRQIPTVHAQCQAIGALEVADMHDLIRRADYPLGWLPDVIDPVPLATIRAENYPNDGVLRIAHAPTDRVIKSTDVIVAAVDRLARRHEFEFDLIERVPNAECLVRKARADIFIDELTLGYGLNALECWSMGIPVISGIADPVTRDLMKTDSGGGLPFLCTDAEMLEACIEDLIVSERDRRHWATAGMNHLQAFHTPRAVVERAIGLFDAVMAVAS